MGIISRLNKLHFCRNSIGRYVYIWKTSFCHLCLMFKTFHRCIKISVYLPQTLKTEFFSTTPLRSKNCILTTCVGWPSTASQKQPASWSNSIAPFKMLFDWLVCTFDWQSGIFLYSWSNCFLLDGMSVCFIEYLTGCAPVACFIDYLT